MPAQPLPGMSSSCLDAGQYGPPVPGDFDPWSSWVIKYGCQVVNACAQILLYNGVAMCVQESIMWRTAHQSSMYIQCDLRVTKYGYEGMHGTPRDHTWSRE